MKAVKALQGVLVDLPYVLDNNNQRKTTEDRVVPKYTPFRAYTTYTTFTVKVVKAVKAIEYAGISLNKKLNPSPDFHIPIIFSHVRSVSSEGSEGSRWCVCPRFLD